MTHFRIGDRVQLVRGTMLWGSREDLAGKSGKVTALVDDGTRLERITVSYDGTIEFSGMYAGMFERLDVVTPLDAR